MKLYDFILYFPAAVYSMYIQPLVLSSLYELLAMFLKDFENFDEVHFKHN